jgi:signal transduction histidine kinase
LSPRPIGSSARRNLPIGNRRDRRAPARLLRLGFLLLLATAVAQVLWWELDQTRYARDVERQREQVYETDATAAIELVRRGASADAVEGRWPHLEVRGAGSGAAPAVVVREEARAALREERRRHLNQYRWEGAFFLLVLLVGIALLGRVLQQEAELRRRQQNFLAAVSHELKSPIASLLLATETMVRRPLDEGRRAELLGRNLKDLSRLERLISNLLAVPALESGRLELERARVELAPVVAEVLADLEAAGYGRARDVEARVPAGLAVEADPVGVATVLRNLIENALQATEEGGTVTVEARDDAGGVSLAVTDRGVGFEPAEARRLFEMFYRPGDELRRRKRGTGLGLYLVQRFVQLEGGTVRASSEGLGHGARFDVSWPAPPPEET